MDQAIACEYRMAGRLGQRRVISWRDRHKARGIAVLDDAPRSGRHHEIDEIEVMAATLVNDGRPPQRTGLRTGPLGPR
ncbi:MAG TPA: hypothetical protein VGI64_11445 [Streptosporangiaceae bacterium]